MRHLVLSLLLAALPIAAHADWTSDTSRTDFFWAATTNDDGQTFGQYCYHKTGKSMWLIAVPTNCDAGSVYPALVNSTNGSNSVELLCVSQASGARVLAFTDFEKIDGTVRKSEKLGIAIPLENDRFRVFRFELYGASSVLDQMRAEAIRFQSRGSAKPKSGRGEYL